MKRSTLVALIVLVALGAYVYWTNDDPVGDDGETVFELSKEDVDHIEIIGRETVVLERSEEGWRLSEPLEAPADATEVDVVLDNLETMELDRRIPLEDGMSLEEFGLDEPRLSVRFRAAGDDYELRFGDDTLTPSNQYAQRTDENDVLIVATYLSGNLDLTAWELRDKSVFHVGDDATPSRVEIQRGDTRIELLREGELWTMIAHP